MFSRRIGITLGDPCGVGPELVAQIRQRYPLLRVFGDVNGFSPGRPDSRSALAQVTWLEAAAEAARRGELDALVTGPISKAQAQSVGWAFSGQTEFLAARLGAEEVCMMMASPRLRVALATTHLSIREAVERLSRADVGRAIRMAAAALRDDFCVRRPRIGVCGLNPHAGESGLLGREEIEIVAPAIDEMRSQVEAELVGPVSPDTAFAPIHEPPFDAIVALYHDQGLIPIKALAFHETVNVTLGLPIARTSPDHGVAYDLAGTGRANPSSMDAAVRLAITLAQRRGAGSHHT